MKNRIENTIVNDAMGKLHQYMNSVVPQGTSVSEVMFTAQKVHTAIQILAGNLSVIESKITLEYHDEKPE